MLLSAIATEYLAWTATHRNYSVHTTKNYRSDLLRWAKWAGDIDAAELSVETMEEYFAHLLHPIGREMRAQTVCRNWNTVRNCLRWGIKRKYFYAEVIPEDLEMPEDGGSRRVHLSDDDVKAVRDATLRIPDPYKSALVAAIIALLSSAALRCDELTRLEITDILLDASKVVVRKGKGNKRRTVPVSDKCVAAVRAYLALRPKSCQHDFLLCHDRIRRVSNYGARKILRDVAHIAGYKDAEIAKFKPHTFRHNCAVRFYVNSGFDIVATKDFLGHTDIRTTQIYLHVESIHLHNMRNLTDLDMPSAEPPPNSKPATPDTSIEDMERLMPLMMSMMPMMFKMMKEFDKK